MTTNIKYNGSAKSGGIKHWFFQRWTGMLLICMLITHFVISHFHGHPYVTYDMVMERLANPVWKFFDLSFLYLAAYHGIMGVLAVVSDYKISAILKVTIYSVAMAIMAYIVIFGTITILSVNV
jgi:succinate dehydrogenase / fumarate reductase membrane anchor subunit